MDDISAKTASKKTFARCRRVQNVRIYIHKEDYEVTIWWEEGSFSSSLEPDVRVIDKSIVSYSRLTEYELALMCDEDIKKSVEQEHLRKEFLKSKRAGRLHEVQCP